MAAASDWNKSLANHPVFSAINSGQLSKLKYDYSGDDDQDDDDEDVPKRRQTMVLKETDLFVAAGRQVRVASLAAPGSGSGSATASLSASRSSNNKKQTFKTLHTPNIGFEIHELALNPSGKLLAVAGSFRVAVIVLPRSGFNHLVPDVIDCKSVQVGQHYHASKAATPIAKIDWHPWGDSGSTLMVMTIDGKLREYDISVNPSEPSQELSFFPHANRRGSFLAADESERLVSSFTLGKGRADWGPLTIYAVTRSGDVYSICPYLPQNAAVPPTYIHSLECFVSQKQDVLSQGTSSAAKNLSTVYDYQRKYVSGLIKQLPAGTAFPSSLQPRTVSVHPPPTMKQHPARQGPFLMKPEPKDLEGSGIENEATDIKYISFGEAFTSPESGTDEDEGGETENLGVVLIASKDGKVDLCLDVEKIEARWESKQSAKESPMLLVYETIDLGLVSMLKDVTPVKGEPSPLEQLEGNHPLFFQDPIHEGTVYVYHAFGVHSLDTWPLLEYLRSALKQADEASAPASLESALQKCPPTEVNPILTTFSVERRVSSPVIAVTIPNDIYLTYSIFILTAALRISCFPLNLRTEYSTSDLSASTNRPLSASLSSSVGGPQSLSISASTVKPDSVNNSKWLQPLPSQPSVYVSLLSGNPYTVPPIFSRSSAGLPSNPRLSLPPSTTKSKDFMLTPDVLRYLGNTVLGLQQQIHDVRLAQSEAETRAETQKREVARLCDYAGRMITTLNEVKGPRRQKVEEKYARLLESQKALLGRMEKMLRGILAKASPELNESEKKWFEELERMKNEVLGSGKWDERSLLARARLVEVEYERVLPLLKQIEERERVVKERNEIANQDIGFNQAFELGKKSEEQQIHIQRLEKTVVDLAKKLDLDLGLRKD